MRTMPTTTNPTPMDVLAVMDAAAMDAYQRGAMTGDKHYPGVREYEQARAAIAELIESAAIVVKPYRGDAYAGPDIERLESALARVGGA